MIYVFHEVAVMCDDINDVLSRQAIAAHGVDRHLLGLRMLANESGMEMPQIFTDVAYTRSTHWLLSTSQVWRWTGRGALVLQINCVEHSCRDMCASEYDALLLQRNQPSL